MPLPLRIFGRKRFRQRLTKALHIALVSVLVLQSVSIGGFAFSRSAQAAELPADATVETATPVITTTTENPDIGCRLVITKSVSQETAVAGDILTYTISYENTGRRNCTGGGVRIDDMVPNFVTYTGIHSQSTSNDLNQDGIQLGYQYSAYGSPVNYPVEAGASLLSWNANIVSPGESGTITWQGVVDQKLDCGTIQIENTAKITADELNQWIYSNTVSTSVTTECYKEPTLTVVKTIGQQENIPGWTWKLDGSEQPLAMGFSNPQVVTLGSHTVTEIQQPGYENIGWSCFQNVTDGPHPILGIGTAESFTVNVPQSGATCYFNNRLIEQKLGTISGYKMDPQEHPLQGWQICYNEAAPTKGVPESQGTCTTTNAQGYYEFTNVPFGVYDIRETMQSGWTPVSPAHGVYYYQSLTEKDPILERNFVNQQEMTNISVTKTDGLTTANPGQQLTYTMVVSNTSNVAAMHVTAVDTLPSHFTYESSTINTVAASPAISGSTVTWHIGTLAAGAAATITMTGTLDTTFPFGTTSLTNSVVVHTETAETTLEDNTASDTDTVTTSSVLGLEKAGPSVITAGGNLVYTLHWSVTGTATVTHATITDPFPANTSFVAQTCGTTTGTCVATQDATHVVWDLGTRVQGEHGTVTLTLQSSAALADGVLLTNTATFDSVETPAVQASVVTTVHNTVQGSPILSITKTNNIVSFTNPGKIVTYTVVVKNAAVATAAAINVMVTDTLPEGFTFVDTGLATKTVAIGTITPGNSVTLTYDVQISPIVSSGSYINTATAQGDNTEKVSATSLVPIRVPEVLGATTEPTLTLEKSVNVTKPIASGSIITYTLKITNTGDADAVNVAVTDVLPKGFTFLLDGTGTKIWNIGTLKPNHSRVIVFDVKISNGVINGSYKNVATLTATDLPKITATATVEVKNPRVLGLATTGAGTIEYVVLLLSALSLLVGASLMISNRHGYRSV